MFLPSGNGEMQQQPESSPVRPLAHFPRAAGLFLFDSFNEQIELMARGQLSEIVASANDRVKRTQPSVRVFRGGSYR